MLTSEQVLELFNKAMDQADLALWEEIKQRPDSRDKLLAAADALEVTREEFYALMAEYLKHAA
jgi:hypothetical protein